MDILKEQITSSMDRVQRPEILKQFHYFSEFPLLLKFVDAIPIPVMVLNKQRQIVYSNKILLEITGKKELQIVFGMRPGEILSCSHAFETSGGCGTTEFCNTCGALKAIILASDESSEQVQEARIITNDNEALDLKVYSSPLNIGDDEFTIFTVRDISDEKRRQNLERIFFHDLLNTASSVKALVYNLEMADPQDSDEFRTHLMKLSDKLVEEICAQRDIYAAEINELAVNLSRCNNREIINDIIEQFSLYNKDKQILISEDSKTSDFYTDKILIRRVLSNMLKNALEATPEGGKVTISSYRDHNCMLFTIHNPGFIEKEIQLQIFQRSFSTKGFGRGVGTYSMKLLCENYLHGKVNFTTSKTEGTTFYCKVPLNLE
jgi:K+-sensing histidine kinase KdpD